MRVGPQSEPLSFMEEFVGVTSLTRKADELGWLVTRQAFGVFGAMLYGWTLIRMTYFSKRLSFYFNWSLLGVGDALVRIG